MTVNGQKRDEVGIEAERATEERRDRARARRVEG